MSVDFSDVKALTNGAKFVRGDLHIHSSGGSHDVSDTTATPLAIVHSAKANGLQVVAIADHNSIDNVQAGLTASSQDILVVPAVELSTVQGHLLCYLPDLASLQKFYLELTVRDFGLATSRVENSMIDCLGKLQQHNGFGVLAHVDGPKGLEIEMPGGSAHKSDILCHPALLGIELRNAVSDISYGPNDPDNIRRQFGVQRRERNNGTVSALARILNSDSHALAALGRNASGDHRVTRYKLHALTFESLRHALRDSDARVRLEDELPRMVPVVTGLRFKGGFLRDQMIHLSPNLTCIIGGRGTGKSTTFEAIRCFSNNPSGNTVVNSDVWPDRTDLQFVDEVGGSHVLSWSHGDTSGANLTDPFEGPDTIPVECYGQGETQKISQLAQNDPGALLSYLDRFTDVSAELAQEETARRSVSDIEAKIGEARAHVSRISEQERQLAIIKQQIKRYQDGNAKSIIETYQQIERERQTRRSITEEAQKIATCLDYETAKKSIQNIKSAAKPSELRVGLDEFTAITQMAETFEAGLSASEADLRARSVNLSNLVNEKIRAWSEKENTLLATADTQKATLEAQGVKVNTAYIGELTQNEAKYQAGVTNLKTWVPHLALLETQREELTAARWVARGAVNAKRKAFATEATKRLRESLTDLNVTLKFEQNGHSPQGQDLIVEIMQWRTTQVARIPALLRKLTIPRLIECVRSGDTGPIQALRTEEGVPLFTHAEAKNLIERFSEPDALSRLQTVPVYDRPYLTVTREQKDTEGNKVFKTREFAQLSLGQQQSVLLALMLSSDNGSPLLIDQPEDNLDSQFIFSQLVPVIRRAKERRQIIVVTHNPNIAVLGDAELIIVLEANNEQALITSRGSIDDDKSKEAACKILEGARAAFVRRGQVYGVV